MVREADFGYYFEEVGRGVSEGAQDPRSEHFSGAVIEDAVVREVIQNSLDARTDDAASVEVVFELDQLAVHDLPGAGGLRRAAGSAAEAVGDATEGAKRIRAVSERLAGPSISVLRIADYGTTGLTGDENVDGGLHALTRSSGVSSSGGGRGGSFGIGAAVGVMASGISTVGYLTRRTGADETIYASWSQLTGHVDAQGIQRRARGIFTHADIRDRLNYPRFGAEGFGPFGHRNDLGTTVLIFDYINAESDSRLLAIRRAVLRNFLVAVLEGDLVVTGRGVSGEWRLDSATLDSVLQEDSELRERTAPFRRAMELEPIVKTLPRIGEVELRILELGANPDGSLPRSLDTMLMRRPRMLIEFMKHRGLPKPYAAVFICRNEEGNELLRALEGPSHDGWKSRGVRGDARLVTIVRDFIKESLRDALGFRASDSLDVENLSRMLPKLDREKPMDELFVDQGTTSQNKETWGTVPSAADRTGDSVGRVPKPIPVPAVSNQSGEGGEQKKNSGSSPGEAGPTPESQRSGSGGRDSDDESVEDLIVRSFAGGGPRAVTLVVRNPTSVALSSSLVLHWLDGNNARGDVNVESAHDMDTGVPVGTSRRPGELAALEFPPQSRRRIVATLTEGAQLKLEVSHRAA